MMFAGATFGGGYANAYDPASTAQSLRAILRRKGTATAKRASSNPRFSAMGRTYYAD
ncbi:hypothetical protein NMD95_07540 [Edwardsiella tarda]